MLPSTRPRLSIVMRVAPELRDGFVLPKNRLPVTSTKNSSALGIGIERPVVAVLLAADEEAAAVVSAVVGDDDVVPDPGGRPVRDEDAAAVVVVEGLVADEDVAADVGGRPG